VLLPAFVPAPRSSDTTKKCSSLLWLSRAFCATKRVFHLPGSLLCEVSASLLGCRTWLLRTLAVAVSTTRSVSYPPFRPGKRLLRRAFVSQRQPPTPPRLSPQSIAIAQGCFSVQLFSPGIRVTARCNGPTFSTPLIEEVELGIIYAPTSSSVLFSESILARLSSS